MSVFHVLTRSFDCTPGSDGGILWRLPYSVCRRRGGSRFPALVNATANYCNTSRLPLCISLQLLNLDLMANAVAQFWQVVAPVDFCLHVLTFKIDELARRHTSWLLQSKYGRFGNPSTNVWTKSQHPVSGCGKAVAIMLLVACSEKRTGMCGSNLSSSLWEVQLSEAIMHFQACTPAELYRGESGSEVWWILSGFWQHRISQCYCLFDIKVFRRLRC